MTNFIPVFDFTDKMVNLVSSIMRKAGQADNYNNMKNTDIIRRNNRIRSVCSSVSIEGNILSLEQVKYVLADRMVIAPPKDIIEVKNAFAAYEMMRAVNPYSADDLKKVHGIMNNMVTKDTANFRQCEEGVFDGEGNCIYVCPPPDRVPELMEQLFSWMNEKKETLLPLILSSAFHYELVHIHPFSDGNGRMARLWQDVILSGWEGVFESVPIECYIDIHQADYYKVINDCNEKGNASEFIEFILKMTDEAMDDLLKSLLNLSTHISKYVSRLLNVMEPGVPLSTAELMEKLEMKSRVSLREHYILPALENGLIRMTNPGKPTSKNQGYYRVGY